MRLPCSLLFYSSRVDETTIIYLRGWLCKKARIFGLQVRAAQSRSGLSFCYFAIQNSNFVHGIVAILWNKVGIILNSRVYSAISDAQMNIRISTDRSNDAWKFVIFSDQLQLTDCLLKNKNILKRGGLSRTFVKIQIRNTLLIPFPLLSVIESLLCATYDCNSSLYHNLSSSIQRTS